MPASTTEKAFWFGLGALVSYTFLRQFTLTPPPLPTPQAQEPTKDYKALSNDLHDLRDQIQWQYQGLISEQEGHFRQTQALLSLYHQLTFTIPLPPMRHWSIGPDFATLIVTHLREHQPNLVLDVGGGLSTLLAAYCLQEQRVGRVVALDDDPNRTQATVDLLMQHQVELYGEALHAPLKAINPKQPKWIWYDTAALNGLRQIDFVIINTPSGASNLVRDAALPILAPLLSQNAIILMDGVQREDEKYLVDDWIDEFNLLLLNNFETEKGATLLQKL